MTELGTFLAKAASDRSPWNCSTLPADWCLALGHPDFAVEWRGVTEQAECEQLGERLIELWDRGIGAALPPADPDALLRGDILVLTAGGLAAGAIWTGQHMALKAARGLHFIKPEAVTVVKAWRPTR